jgi:hypothetical protein
MVNRLAPTYVFATVWYSFCITFRSRDHKHHDDLWYCQLPLFYQQQYLPSPLSHLTSMRYGKSGVSLVYGLNRTLQKTSWPRPCKAVIVLCFATKWQSRSKAIIQDRVRFARSYELINIIHCAGLLRINCFNFKLAFVLLRWIIYALAYTLA